MAITLGYLGPRGTFSEEAALLFNRSGERKLQEYSSIAEVIEGVGSGNTDEGIVPLENSLEGSVAVTLDLLLNREGIMIRRELVCPIHHCLLAPPGLNLNGINRVYSHPQALGQCRRYLQEKLPEAVCYPVESTAAAAGLAQEHKGAAAIAPRRAAELFNLCLLAEGIQDHNDNATRFVVVARRDHPPTGRDKTSLVLAIPDGPGSLYRILGYFARRHINLTRIESRPARRNLGEYLFFIDCEGHRSGSRLKELWAQLEREVVFLKLLGSYPRHG